MSVITVTKENFEQEVLQKPGRVLLDLWAAWCGPCRMISPVVDRIAAEDETLTVGKINVDEQPELAQAFEILSIPTLILFKDGKYIDRIVGVVPKPVITRFLAQ